MKVAVFTDCFYPTLGGIATCISALIKKLADNGHEILLVTQYLPGIENYTYKNIEVIALKGIPSGFNKDFKITYFSGKTKKQIIDFDPDIFHIHTPFLIGYTGIKLAAKLGKKSVYTFHTYINDEKYINAAGIKNKYMVKGVSKFLNLYDNFFFKRADHIISPSKNVVDYINQISDIKNISVIPNPVPFEDTAVQHNYLDGILSKNIVLYIGRLSTEKNIEFSIKAFQKVVEKINDSVFVIVGNGPIEADLKKMVENMSIKNNIIFLGGIEHGKLINSDIFLKSKLFLTCSKTENLPMTLLEALYFGLPLVGVVDKGVGELIENGFNGYKSQEDIQLISENIIRILSSDEIRQTLSENARKYAENYKLENIITQLENLYKSLINI